jgi:hypothetical protein
MTKKRASEDALGALHEALAQHMLNVLKGDEVKAADLNVIRQFLKDNGIEVVPNSGSTLDKVADIIPVFEDEDEDEQDVRH